MLDTYDFTLNAACKEARISRATAKKWLGKRRREEEEVYVKFLKPAIPVEKAQSLVEIKRFIDDRGGNIFLKDVKTHLKDVLHVNVPLATLGTWVKKDLNYTYKKCSTVSPDIRKVVLVEH